MRRRVLLGSTLAFALAPGLLPPRAAAAGTDLTTTGLGLPDRTLLAGAGDRLEIESSRVRTAPGVLLERRGTLDAAGPVRSSVLRLAAGSTTRPDLLQRSLSSPATPVELATTAGAVAAVNGDFFDIDRTGTPDGPVVVAGAALKADAAVQTAVGVEGSAAGWTGRVGQLVLQGTVTVGPRTYPLAALGTRTVPADAVAVFSTAWGSGNRASTAPGGVELEVRAGRVTAVRAPGATAVPADGFVLVATGTVADALRTGTTGAAASTSYTVRNDALPAGSGGFALGARLELVRDGTVAPIDTADPTWAALRARTAIGWTAAGDLLLLTVDGGTARSRGVTALETAQLMVEAGARGAVMLDGGGSAQLVARTPGETGVSVVGEPSDGGSRPVANAVGLVPPPGDGRLAEVLLRSSSARLFPGTRRTVTALGLDASGAPVALTGPGWAVTGGVSLDPAGTRAVLRGTTPGAATVQLTAGTVRADLAVTVLGPLTRLDLGAAPVLPVVGSTVEVTVTGRDAQGRAAVVEAADLTVATDPALLRTEPLPEGRLRLTALGAGPTGTTTTTLTLTAGAVTRPFGVTIGLRDTRIDTLDDTGRWTVATTRATASLTRVPVTDLPGAGAALRLDYDFRDQPAGTTVASVLPTSVLPLPVGSRELALQVRGDSAGGWLRGVLRVDGAGRPVTFAARVDWSGWRRLVVPVPGDARSVSVERLYLAQTDAGARTAGRLELALLDARVAPTVAADPGDPADPVLGAVADPTRSVALLGATHVRAAVAASVAPLEQALTAAVASGVRQLLLTGDVVGPVGGRGTTADVDLVRQVLARTVPAGVRWTWLPGDGEVGTPAAVGLDSGGSGSVGSGSVGSGSGGGDATHRRLDVAGTRYLLLDSGGGSLRAADWSQLPWLREELSAAATAGLAGVVVVSPRGPGSAADDLVDPDESTLLRSWTTALHAAGTPVTLVSSGPVTRVGRSEGVLELDLPGDGAWTLLGAGPAGAGEVRADVRTPGPVVRRLARVVRPRR